MTPLSITNRLVEIVESAGFVITLWVFSFKYLLSFVVYFSSSLPSSGGSLPG